MMATVMSARGFMDPGGQRVAAGDSRESSTSLLAPSSDSEARVQPPTLRMTLGRTPPCQRLETCSAHASRTSAPAGVPAAQRLLLDIIDTVREPLIVLDAEFRVTQANRAFFRTFQVEPAGHDRRSPVYPRRRPVGHRPAPRTAARQAGRRAAAERLRRRPRVSRHRPQDHAAQRPARVAGADLPAHDPPGHRGHHRSAASRNGAWRSSTASWSARTRRWTSSPRSRRTTCRSRCARSSRSATC